MLKVLRVYRRSCDGLVSGTVVVCDLWWTAEAILGSSREVGRLASCWAALILIVIILGWLRIRLMAVTVLDAEAVALSIICSELLLRMVQIMATLLALLDRLMILVGLVAIAVVGLRYVAEGLEAVEGRLADGAEAGMMVLLVVLGAIFTVYVRNIVMNISPIILWHASFLIKLFEFCWLVVTRVAYCVYDGS